jgi:hypothetical protein
MVTLKLPPAATWFEKLKPPPKAVMPSKPLL